MNGALNAIAYARQSGCPFLGTCGGFQHAVLEYARNVLGHTEADHAESNPAATMPLIAPLACTLVGTRGEILLQQDSKIADIYGTLETTEEYHCSYGLNPAFQRLLASGALKISGADESKSARVIEHSAHPFFMATLFQPELKGPDENPHPVIKAFVQAALARSNLK